MSEPATQAGELDELIGTTLAERYRIDQILGVGGMGAVFQARHLLLKRDVAVKVLHPSLSTNEDLSKRFDREAQSAARLDHPNVIPVSEFGSTKDGMKYMVMPVLQGSELADVIDGPLDPLRAIDLEIQILRGLEHAHDNGVVHRDLKPENVFVTTDHDNEEILKLVDFGIAKILDEDPEEDGDAQPLTRLGLVFGTPQYMSPEQATGSEIDHRTDIYSAGVILYHMLAGKIPFDNEDPVALIRMQVTLDPPPLPDTVPPALQRVVSMMMAKTRDQRYADARSARKALQSLQTKLAGDKGIELKFSPHDTGVVDPRDIYPPGHEALQQNPAFGSGSASASNSGSGSGSGSDPQLGVPGTYNASEHSASNPGTGVGRADSTIPPLAPLGSGSSNTSNSAPKVTMSLADALTSAHPTFQDKPSPLLARLSALPRTYWYVGGGVLALLLIIAMVPSSKDDDGDGGDSGEANESAAVIVADTGEEPEPVVSSVDAAVLAEIDKILSGKNSVDSLNLIRPELDKFPDDPQLVWREGKAMSFKKTKSDRVIALERYGKAYELDPTLIDNHDFYAELTALLNNTQLREQAISLAVQKLDKAGHKFLIEQVNNKSRSLGWSDRQRALDALRTDPDANALVDWPLNLRRDLEKAEHAPQPCAAFATALDAIAQSKAEYYVDAVFTVAVPAASSDEDDAQVCELLEAKLLVVQELMTVAQPEASAKYARKKKKKKKR